MQNRGIEKDHFYLFYKLAEAPLTFTPHPGIIYSNQMVPMSRDS